MADKVTTLYSNISYQSANGSAGWSSLTSHVDNNLGTTTYTSLFDSNTVLSASYSLVSYFTGNTPPWNSGDPYTGWGSKKIKKVEVGWYTDVVSNWCAGNRYGYVLLNGSWVNVFVLAWVGFATSAPNLTWVDITTASGAPDIWTGQHVRNLQSLFYCAHSAVAGDVKTTYSTIYLYETFIRVTWVPQPVILFGHNF